MVAVCVDLELMEGGQECKSCKPVSSIFKIVTSMALRNSINDTKSSSSKIFGLPMPVSIEEIPLPY